MSHDGAAERRARFTQEIMTETGIDEALIERLVRTFYGRVQQHELLGPVFAAKISDWDDHLARLCAFWSSVVLMTGRYHGRPMQKHLGLSIEGRHFDAWLNLFEATALEVCPRKAALHFIDRARRIADSLEMGVASQHNELYTPRHVSARPALGDSL